MIRKPGAISSTLLLVLSNGSSNLLGFARGIFVAGVLAPSELGILSLLMAAFTYANYADLGINTGMILKVPKLIGRGQTREAESIQRQVYLATLVVIGVLSVLAVLIALGLPIATKWVVICALLVAGALVFGLINYYNTIVRIRERFGLISLSTVAIAVVTLAAVIVVSVVVSEPNAEIIVLCLLTGFAAGALILGMGARVPLSLHINWSTIWCLAKIGLPVSLIPIGFVLFQSVDRWVVATRVPPDEVGYYGLGAIIGAFLYTLPAALGYVLFTKQIERFGTTGDPKASEPLVFPPLLVGGYIMAFLAGGVVLMTPLIINHLLPAYSPSTYSVALLVIANSLLFGVPVAVQFLISTGRQRQVFVMLGAGLAVKAGLVFFLVQTRWGITGAALAVLIADVVYCSLVTFWAVRLLGGAVHRQVGRVVLCFVPFGICLPVAGLLLIIGSPRGELWSDLVRLVWQGALFVLIGGGLCLLTAWASGVLKRSAVAKLLPATLARAFDRN